MPRVAVVVFLSLFATSCATTAPGANAGEFLREGMVPSTSPSRIVLADEVRHSEKRGLFGGVLWTEAVCAGTYTPEFEDAAGTYFRAPRACVENILGRDPMGGPFNGGIWLPKDRSQRPRFYYYFGYDSAAAWQAGGLIAASIMEAGKGKVTFMPPIKDDRAVSQIWEGWSER